MALRKAWWLSNERESLRPVLPNESHLPHETWPWHLPSNGPSLMYINARMRANPGSLCDVEKLHYDRSHNPPRWAFSGIAENASELVNLAQKSYSSEVNSVAYIVKSMQKDAIQALSYFSKIPPRYFNMPHTGRNIGQPLERFMYFTLQFMDKYSGSDIPSEALRDGTSPSCRFRIAPGIYHKERWHMTCIRIIIVRLDEGTNFSCLIEIDPKDHMIGSSLRLLMTREDEMPFGEAEIYSGLGRMLAHTFYNVTYIWNIFLREAQRHLQILSEKCVDLRLTQEEQLNLRHELNQLSRLWLHTRRLIVSAKHILDQVTDHPFFASINGSDGRPAIALLLAPQSRLLSDQITWCNDLAEQTTSLVSLTFNISQLQDTKAAIEESKAANALASSIRRVTMLTFIYLPLTLASSIFGMNVRQITGDGGDSPLWAYFVLAATLTVATFGGWYIWSQAFPDLKQRVRRVRLQKMF